MRIRQWRGWIAVLCLTYVGAAFTAYPERAIRLISPFASGGNIDITARTTGPGLSEQLGRSEVVENRSGSGRIDTEIVVSRNVHCGHEFRL